MQFKIKSPCANCPFRQDVAPFLHRAPQIAKQLRNDNNWFACHQTTGVKNGKRIRPRDQSHCIGAAIVLWRRGLANIAMRIALVCGLLKRETLETNIPVFNSLEEFIEHHEQA